MKLALAGPGAFGTRHLEALARTPGAEVALVVGQDADQTRSAAERFGVGGWSLELAAALERPDIEAVILATPTPLHARQAALCLAAGKPVLVEIPLADNLADAEMAAEAARRSGLAAMCGHTRRFNPSHRWLRRRIAAGELKLLQLDVQTQFMRRSNLNALGQPRSWTDHLLWHHAAHTVDLFRVQTGEPCAVARGLAGRPHPDLGVAMDMSIQLKTPSGALCTLSLSFNNDGPFGSFFRYVCDEGTFLARYDELTDGWGAPVDVASGEVSADGVELQDREFLAAIAERRAPEASFEDVLDCYRTLAQIEQTLD
jgi:2-hydroxy-4-carboxymuconate semialdehyde hemiacetal dehydrogenase